MDFDQTGSPFRNCKCHHEVESRMISVKETILEAHLEVKNQLIRNLEDIIDEQEARIRNMDDYINGRTNSLTVRNKIMKGISLLSLEFGTLGEENLALKEALVNAHRSIRLLQMKIEDPAMAEVPTNVNNTYQTDETNQQNFSRINTQLCQMCEVGDQKQIQHIQDEKNNNHRKRPNKETVAALQKNIKELMETKMELEKLMIDIQEIVCDVLQMISRNVGIEIVSFINSLMQRYQKEVETRKQLHNKLVELNGNIRVFCRIRPSIGNSTKSILQTDLLDSNLIVVENINGERRIYNCDRAFSEKHTQADVFEEICPIITSCMDGYNVCIFAYGHTGSGKTYTMEGPMNDPGVYQRSIAHLFHMAKERSNDYEYKISVSMLEIYNEKIRDLLSKNKTNLLIRIGDNGGLEIPGLICFNVNTLQEVQEVLEKGRLNRACATTDLNDRSSRSHAVVRVLIRAINRTTNIISESRLNLVDLAGSERVSQSGATGQQLKEAQCINRSLSELGNVVNALRQRQQHIPFRNCQLTRLLEDSLNGESKTLMIVQLAPDVAAIQETVSSLNFADKVSKVQARNSNSKTSRFNIGSLSVPSRYGRPRLDSGFMRSMSVHTKK